LASATPVKRRPGGSAVAASQLEELADSAGRALEDQAPGFSKNVPVTVETQGATYGISHDGSSPLKWSKAQEFELAALCMGRGRVMVHCWRPVV
jgi:hypothetical protein